jgi:hypothetical protein
LPDRLLALQPLEVQQVRETIYETCCKEMGSHRQHIMAVKTSGAFFDSHIYIRGNFDGFFAQVILQGISI